MPNIDSILREHTTLQVECIDRIYLHGYVPSLQRPNQLAWFLNKHRGQPFPSPALMGQMTERFVAAIRDFAEHEGIPIVQFKAGERKDDVAKQHLARFRRTGLKQGILFIGVAQENISAFRSRAKRRKDGSVATFEFYRGQVCVNQYYFYVLDSEWGPGFLKFSSYAPFGVRVCLNGHEWAKCQLAREDISFEALDNGFLSCAKPQRLQAICNRLSAEDAAGFCRKWLNCLPHPFTRDDRVAGYTYQFSVWQFEYSLTHVFERPADARHFFEEVLRDNLDLGRPDRIQTIFGRRINRSTPSAFRTRVVQQGDVPKLSAEYKHSRIKQYLKEGRALRTETTINNPDDVDVRKGLVNLPKLREVAQAINRRLIESQRVSHNCVIGTRDFESIVQPSQVQGQSAPGLRFGQPRIMAVLAALCQYLPSHNGFTNRILRERVGALFDAGSGGYTTARMTYDLRRLRLKGLIQRLPHSNRYELTPFGRRIALFFTKTNARIFRPAVARLDPTSVVDSTDALAAAFRKVDTALDKLIEQARISA